MSTAKQSSQSEPLGTIHDDATYPLEVFQRVAGLGKHSMAQLRRQGLQVIRTGNRAFVRGRDFSAFLGRLANLDATSPSDSQDSEQEMNAPDAA